MEKKIFCKKIKDLFYKGNVEITEIQAEKFYLYMNELLEWNKKINLTAITDEDEIILKHFMDSVTIIDKIGEPKNIIDIGTGAGFPGLPIAIMNENIEITLLDSLNKRILFLNDLIGKLELKNVKTVHGRAEDIARDIEYREKYDIVTSRAVAPLNVLLEYMLPFNKVNGICICMKGQNIDEINNANKSIKELGGQMNSIEKVTLPNTDIERNIIVIKKIKNTPKRYPRKAGTPKKNPIG